MGMPFDRLENGRIYQRPFGGSWRTEGGWRFDVGVSEDLQAGASPDIAFNLAVARSYR